MAADEDGVGTVKHARFVLSGLGFAFNEAVSLQVLCKDQAEVDRYWAELSQGGEPGQCDWLKDRFGVGQLDGEASDAGGGGNVAEGRVRARSDATSTGATRATDTSPHRIDANDPALG